MSYEDDFGIEPSDMPGSYMASTHRDEALEMFYNKLGEYNSNWMDLEGFYYKNSRVGKFKFVKQVEQMTE